MKTLFKALCIFFIILQVEIEGEIALISQSGSGFRTATPNF